jgi:hypothetical protein
MPGRYIVRETGPAAGEPRIFAVNVADEVESAIAPKQRPDVPAPITTSADASVTPLQIWPYLVMSALALLILEWWRSGRHA